MRIHITKRQKVLLIILSIFLTIYIGLSSLIGFPLGFGMVMARGIAQDYCQVVYPQATIEKTVYNIVNSSFETVIYLREERRYISTNPNQDIVGDRYREEAFLHETGAEEVLSRLFRTYVSGRHYRFLTCYVSWSHDDPMTPITSLRFDYGDYENPILPNDAQIKKILTPIALDCITQVEACFPLDSIHLFYYHPDFDPEEVGKTWRIIEIPLDDDTPRTNELLNEAQLKISEGAQAKS